MRAIVKALYDNMKDLDFMDYADELEKDIDNLLQDLELLEKQGNGSLLNAIKTIVEE